MGEAIDEIAENAERKLKFRFKDLNLFALRELFSALHDFGGSFELVSSKGIVWTPNDSENLLVRYFSEPGLTHTLRAKTERELKLYMSVFENFPDYVEYDSK